MAKIWNDGRVNVEQRERKKLVLIIFVPFIQSGRVALGKKFCIHSEHLYCEVSGCISLFLCLYIFNLFLHEFSDGRSVFFAPAFTLRDFNVVIKGGNCKNTSNA